MEVRAKKSLGQHFLTDLSIARSIADALVTDGFMAGQEDTAEPSERMPVPALEIGPGMGVLSQYLLERDDIDLKMVEIDDESVDYLLMLSETETGEFLQRKVLHHRKLPLQHIFADFLQGAGLQGVRPAGSVHDTERSGGTHCGKAGHQDLRYPLRTPAGLV